MFQRFTEPARQVVVLAQDEARALRHDHVGTEHLLLGLVREDRGLAARVLEVLEVTLDKTRDGVRAIVGEGPPGEPTPGQIPFSPGAKKTLELALREALTFGHNYVGTEHILLGLVRAGDGPALEILAAQGVDGDLIRDTLLGMLAPPGSPPPRPTARAVPVGLRPRALPPVALLVAGWVLFGLALGIGVLVGWAIWA